jgi:peroxiredoxin
MHKIPAYIVNALLALAATSVLASPAGLVGAPAPDFALRSMAGENLRLSEYRSEVVVLNFWSKWCGKCRNSMTALEALHLQHADADLNVLGVAIEGKATKAAETIAELGLSYPMLLDSTQDVSKAYDLSRLPATLIIDRTGAVRFLHQGFNADSRERMAADIAVLLAE